MALPKLYEQIVWHNNTTPALNEDNLNAMSQAIDDIDDRLIGLAGTIMEDVPQIIEDMEILEPAIESIDENVARAEAAADSAEQYAEEIAPPIRVVKDFAGVQALTDALDKNAVDVKVKVTPKQDLHGYSKPWAGGGGNNKLQNTASTTTDSGVTLTVNSDGTVSCANTSNNTIYFKIFEVTSSSAYNSMFGALIGNSVKLVGCPSGGAAAKYEMHVEMNASTVAGSQDYGSGATFTMPTFNTKFSVYVIIRSGQNMSGKVFKPMLGLASLTNFDYAHFEPYTNICPITGFTEAKVTRTGKNLLPNNATTQTLNRVTFTVNSDKSVNLITGTGTASGNTFYILASSFVLPKGNYKLSIGSDTGAYDVRINGHKGDDYVKGIVTVSNGESSFTVDYDGYDNLRCFIYVTSGASISAEKTVYPMIRPIAFKDSTYEPYDLEVFTISLNGTRYGGTLDVTSGVLTIDRVFESITSVEQISTNTTGYSRWQTAYHSGIKAPTGNSQVGNIKSNMFEAVSADNTYYRTEGIAIHINTRIIFYSSAWAGMSAADVNTMLSTNPVEVVYELATPVTVQLTATEVALLYAYNVLWADTGDLALTYDASGVLRIANSKLDIDTFKSIVASSSDFADFKSKVAAL